MRIKITYYPINSKKNGRNVASPFFTAETRVFPFRKIKAAGVTRTQALANLSEELNSESRPNPVVEYINL